MIQDPFFRSLLNLNRVFNNDVDTETELNFVPGINVKEREKEYDVQVAAPGFEKNDFENTVDNGILTISAEKEKKDDEEKEGFVRREFGYSSFSRSMSLPESVDEEKDINAQYKDGILKLTVPKKKSQNQNLQDGSRYPDLQTACLALNSRQAVLNFRSFPCFPYFPALYLNLFLFRNHYQKRFFILVCFQSELCNFNNEEIRKCSLMILVILGQPHLK